MHRASFTCLLPPGHAVVLRHNIEQVAFQVLAPKNRKNCRRKCSEASYVPHSPAIYHILLTAFRMFRLFFADLCDDAHLEKDVQVARDKLDYFYTRYLATLKV